MPDLYLPIFFGHFDLQNHLITCWIQNQKKIITGAMNGEIIIWNFIDLQFTPILKLTPHILYPVGGVTALQIMKRPFAEFQDNRMNCVISMHQDKRMRLWSLNDGKLILISDHDQFPYTRQITQILPIGERDNRYVVCFGEGTAVYIYDLWKMCCSKIFQISEEFDCPKFCIVTSLSNDFAIVDQKLRVYKIDTKSFKRPERQNYLKYVEKKQSPKQLVKSKEPLIRLASAYSLKGLPSHKIINSLYNPKSQILYIVYPKLIAAVWQPFTESEQQREMCFISSSVAMTKFRNIHTLRQQDQQIMVAEQIDGSCSFIFESDIIEILTLLKQGVHAAITMGFGGLSFQKSNHHSIGQLQIIMQQQLTPSTISKYFYQSTIFANNDILIRQNGSTLEAYHPNQWMDERMKFCSLQAKYENKAQSEGFTLFLNIDSYAIDENQTHLPIKTTQQVTDLNKIESSSIMQQLHDNLPMKEYFDQIGEICCYTLGLYNKSDLFIFIGTTDNMIYAIPFFYDKNKAYQVYKNQCNSRPQSLMFRRNSLFLVDTKLLLSVYSFSSIFGKFEYQPIEFIPTYSCALSSNIKQTLSIRELSADPTSYPNQQIKRKIIKHLVAMQLEDNSIFIYHTTLNLRKFNLPNVFQVSDSPIKLYYIPTFMYFMAQKGNQISIWTIEKGTLERIVNLDYLQQNQDLYTYLQDQLSLNFNPHDFRTFKTETVSQLDLLEFSNRNYQYQHNYCLECKNMSKLFFYDMLGLLQKQPNHLEYSEILNILYHEMPNIISHSKSAIIFEQYNQQPLFPLFQTYLKQFNASIPFEKLNKLYQNQKLPKQNSFLIWFDCKATVQKIKVCIENSTKLPLNYVNFYNPCNIFPVFKCQYGLQGMGEGFSRTFEFDSWQISGLMATQYGVAAALSLKCVKNRFTMEELNYKSSLLSLARFCLDKQKDVIEIACQMISIQLRKMEQLSNDMLTLHRSSKDFLLFFERNGSQQQFFSLEIMCLILQTYLSRQMANNEEMNNQIFNRISYGLQHQLCLQKPNVLFIFLKLMDDGMEIFHKCIVNPKIHLLNLISLYYHVYTALKNKLFLNELVINNNQSKKSKEKDKYELLKQYSLMDREDLQRMKGMLRQLIVHHCQYFFEEFKQCVKETLCVDQQSLINCCILDLMRNIAKNEIQPRDLQFFLDSSIKTIDQINPIQRRHSYKTLIKFIYSLTSDYKYVSYSQERQKLALAYEGIIQIYDLRYGVKLSSLDRYQSQITSIAFDNKGAQLATYSSKDQNIKVFQLKPTGSFLQCYENVYIKISHHIVNVESGDYKLEWDEDSHYVYLQHQEESLVFRIE